MNDTTKNFWEAWNQWHPVESAIIYRLYHDEEGYPLFYSMEDLPGLYIEIDQKTFARSSSHVKVVDGRLVDTKRINDVPKLRPCTQGTPCHPLDVCVIVDDTVEHVKWSKNDKS